MTGVRLLFDVLLILGGALGLLLLHWSYSKGIELLPLEPATRTRLRRTRPLLALALSVILLLWATQTFFGHHELFGPLSLLIVLIGFFAAAARPLRDYLAGATLIAEGTLRTGDQVRIGDVKGRIVELGPRGISLETSEGDRAFLPYFRARENAVVRMSGSGGGTVAHSFRVPRPANLAEARHRIHVVVQRHHFSALGRQPDVHLVEGGLEVTVVALDAGHVLDIEAQVRDALEVEPESRLKASSEARQEDAD